MDELPVSEILELPVAERLRLLELIWDSVAQLPESVSLSGDLPQGATGHQASAAAAALEAKLVQTVVHCAASTPSLPLTFAISLIGADETGDDRWNR